MINPLKSIISITAIVLLAGAAVFFVSCAEKKTAPERGNAAPRLDIRDIRSGQAINIDQLKGKVVFVNFWASWCMPCKEEMPSIEALYKDMLKNDKFLMVTILYKDDERTASDYMRANGYTFPLYADNNGSSAKQYGVTGVPETYLIDKKGSLRKRIIGPADWNSSEAKAYINAMLSE